MAYTYSDLQSEVKRRAVRDQGGTQFDTAVKNILNTSLFRLSRECYWKQLRRKSTVATKKQYTTGTINATLDSSSYTGTSLSWLTEGVDIGRRLKIEGSSKLYIIETITGENAFTTNLTYDVTSNSAATYTLYGQEEYNLPIQAGRVAFLWHEDFGYPYVLKYVPDFTFYSTSATIPIADTPTHYRMWGEDMVIDQPRAASVMRITSSASADTSIDIVVFGTVSGYPDFETITTNGSNGTTAVSGSKSFTKIERIVKGATSTGRITVDCNSANTTVAVLPVGDSTGTIQYQKIQIYPLPTRTFNINVEYYKDPWRLVNSNDVHELGYQFDEALICLAVAKIKAENSQKEASSWYQLYADEVKSLKLVNADKPDWLIELERPKASRGRDLNGLVSYGQVGGLYGESSHR